MLVLVWLLDKHVHNLSKCVLLSVRRMGAAQGQRQLYQLQHFTTERAWCQV